MKELVIESWIKSLLLNNTIPYHLLDNDFFIEDGMTLKEYWKYEYESFSSLASIHDLNDEVRVEIIYEYKLGEKDYCFIYIYNSMDKIVCKMSITLIEKGNRYLITSNDFKSQIVPKFALEDDQVKEIGMAIKLKGTLLKVVSPQLETVSCHISPDFLGEVFYSVRLVNEDIEGTCADFWIYIQEGDKIVKEKRKIFFDKIQKEMKPYKIKDGVLTLVDELYPVNIVGYSKEKEFKKAYPRNISVNVADYDYLIVTDCLDNDWEVTPQSV